jgi:arylsulfatase A-like enzyme
MIDGRASIEERLVSLVDVLPTVLDELDAS